VRRGMAVFLASTLGMASAALALGEELGVKDAVSAALLAQPRLRAAESEARAATARASFAGWKRLGTFETIGLYTPAQKPLTVEFPGIPPYVPATSFDVRQLETYALNGTFSQPLWTWGAISKSHASTLRDADASRESVERVRQQTVFDATQAFYLAASAQAAVGVAMESLDQRRAFVRATESRARAGTASRLDVLKAELSVAKAESDLLTARNADRLAREALASVCLDPRFRTASLSAVEDTENALPREEDGIATALKNRPDLRSLHQQDEALGLRIQAIRASSLPALAFRASLTQQAGAPEKVFTSRSQLYQVGLALTWDPTDTVRNRARIAEVSAVREGLGHVTRGAEEGVALEVRSALANAEEAGQQVAVAQGAVKTAEEQARVARLAYREGVITSIEARDAEVGLTSAQFALLRSRLDLALARAKLTLALGQ
jgi:outer membrane protein